MVIIVVCLIGLLVGSVFGIFFSSEDTGGQAMTEVVREINTEYDDRLESIKTSTAYDVLEMSGSRVVWKEVLADENNSMWSAVLYGIGTGDGEIVTVALSRIGNVGGDPYWSWYGFNSRVEWCACFVSWCANECGYIENGVIPKYAGCVWAVQWFKDRNQWVDDCIEPTPA